MKTSGLKWNIILQRRDRPLLQQVRIFTEFSELYVMSSPFFTTASGRKDGIVFMILLSGSLDDNTLAAEYTARTTT
jgi:hypothetical protein